MRCKKNKNKTTTKQASQQTLKHSNNELISEGTVTWDQMWNHPNKLLDYKFKYMCIVRVYLLLNQHDFYTSPSYETETKRKTTKL